MKGKVTWQADCSFIADETKTFVADHAVLSLTDDILFHIKADAYEDSFEALDILYTETVLMSDVRLFLEGKLEKVKRANPIKAIGKETLLALETDGKPAKFIKTNVYEFKQILRVAQAKQKYSRECVRQESNL